MLLVVQMINTLFTLYSLVIIARAFLSILGADAYNPIVRFIIDITEPVLAPLRRYTIVGMWDLSPLAALILLTIVQSVITSLLLSLAR